MTKGAQGQEGRKQVKKGPAPSPTHAASVPVPGLTSPSLPSQGSLVLMEGKAPPPTGAVDPRPKDSSLGRKSRTNTGIVGAAGEDEEATRERMMHPLRL